MINEDKRIGLDCAVMIGGALRIFGHSASAFMPSLELWNSEVGWWGFYRHRADGFFSFEEDCFGNQFALSNGTVKQFMAETAAVVDHTLSLEQWLRRALTDPEEEFSPWLLDEWVVQDGPLPFDQNLCAKLPFVLGGAGDNLFPLVRDKSMFPSDPKSDIRLYSESVFESSLECTQIPTGVVRRIRFTRLRRLLLQP